MHNNTLCFLLVVIATLLMTSCATPPSQYQTPIINASDAEREEALQFKSSADNAVLYIYEDSPCLLGCAEYSSIRINDEHLGGYELASFLRVELIPGIHEIRLFAPDIEEDRFYNNQPPLYNKPWLVTVTVKAGDVIFIENDVLDETFQVVDASIGKREVKKLPLVAGSFKIMNKRIITAEEKAWASCQIATTALACRTFVDKYPKSPQASQASAKINKIIADEKAAKQKAKFARDDVLPIKVRKDKYIVALTGYLNTKDYEKALPYFEQLEKLNVVMDPSFEFFYAETLLNLKQTGQAIDKLYQYISNVGSSGMYYTKALELVNAAEALEAQ